MAPVGLLAEPVVPEFMLEPEAPDIPAEEPVLLEPAPAPPAPAPPLCAKAKVELRARAEANAIVVNLIVILHVFDGREMPARMDRSGAKSISWRPLITIRCTCRQADGTPCEQRPKAVLLMITATHADDARFDGIRRCPPESRA
jgi:hypothetical protein